MSNASAVYVISSAVQPTPGVEQYVVTGSVFDGSGRYDGSSFSVGDVIFDESVLGSFRWRILEIRTPPVLGSTLKVLVRYDDEGTPPVADLGPAAGAGVVAGVASTGVYRVATLPSISLNSSFGLTETIYTSMQNSNDRGTDVLVNEAKAPASGTSALYLNSTGSTLAKLTPIKLQANGSMEGVDVSLEADALAVAGVVSQDTLNGQQGSVVGSGKLEDVTTSIAVGQPVFVSKTGGVTSTKPDVGVGGFLGGDYIIKLGIISKNATDTSKKDLIVNISLVGQL